MSEVIKEEDDIPTLEGEVQTPNHRTKDFSCIHALARWLDITRPSNIRVETGVLDGVKIYRLTTIN